MSNNISFPTTVSLREAAGAVVRDRYIRHQLQSGQNVVFRADGNNDVQISGDVTTISGNDFFRMPFTFLHDIKAREVDLKLDEYIPQRPRDEQDAFHAGCPEGEGYTEDVGNAFLARLMMENQKKAA